MEQQYYCREFEDDDSILDSYDGLDDNRILFEKKIKFLLLLKKIGTFNFCGSAKYKEVDKIIITRTDIKNYLESFNIVDSLDWINNVLPNKVISYISKSDYICWENY